MDNDMEMLAEGLEQVQENFEAPEQAIEAAVKKARGIASKLHASRASHLSASTRHKLHMIAHDLRHSLVRAGLDELVTGEDGQGLAMSMVCEDPEECAEAFDQFADACDGASEVLTSAKRKASLKLRRLAHRVASCRGRIDSRKVSRVARHILADATKMDLIRNLSNIENKSRKEQPLRVLLDWKEIARLSPGITKFTKLQDMKVQDVKNVLVCLRGGKGGEEDEEI